METEITDIGKVAITPQKDYQNERTYEWLDVVTYDGAGYMCIAEDGCTGIVPTNTDYWQLLADKGHFTEEDKEEFKKAIVEESKTEINEHTDNKKTELNNYTTELEKSLKNEFDTYETEKEEQLDLYKATLETEMANKKDSLIEEIETAQDDFDANVEEKTNTFNSNVETKTTEFNNNSTEKINAFNSNAEEKIADYDEHVETLTSRIADLEEETEDLFNALDTEKISGTELYIEDAKPCRAINTEIDAMYAQKTTTGAQLLDSADFLFTNNTLKQNGLEVVINEDGSITINGTATNITYLKKNLKSVLEDGNYYFYNFNNINQSNETYYMLIQGRKSTGYTPADYYNTRGYQTDNFIKDTETYDASFDCLFVFKEGFVANNLKLYPVISKTAQTGFEPYTGKIASPSPDYPQAIEQVDSVKLQCTGSNLLDYTKILSTPSTTSGITIKLEANGNITISGKPKYSYFSVIQSKNIVDILKDGETYYLDQSNYNRYFYTEIQAVKGDGSITYIGPQKSCASFKVNKSLFKKYVIRIIGGSLTNWGEEERTVTSNFKLTRQKNLPFEKYIEKTVNIDLKGNKLCAISDTIKDKLLIDKNGNVALQKNVGKNIFDGTTKWKKSAYTGNTIFYLANTQKAKFSDVGICNYFLVKRVWDIDILGLELYDLNNIRVGLTRNSEIQTEDAFNEWLTTHNLEVYYALATPELIDLGQLPELLKTFNGINNIWAETNLGNTEIEIEYVQDVKKLLKKQDARLDNIEALLSTTETSALLLDNMQNDLEKEVE